jgi:hypothetical protein
MVNENELIKSGENYQIGIFDSRGWSLLQRVAMAFSKSQMVPMRYQEKQEGGLSSCIIALNMALRMGADPLMVMQNLDVIQGRPSFSAKFLIATVNSCGRFSSIRYTFVGQPNSESWGCFASATEKSTGQVLDGDTITLAMANAEGWTKKPGSKWLTMPGQMLRYRAASFWVRVYAPELAMGLISQEEAADIIDAHQDNDGAYQMNQDYQPPTDKGNAGVIAKLRKSAKPQQTQHVAQQEHHPDDQADENMGFG